MRLSGGLGSQRGGVGCDSARRVGPALLAAAGLRWGPCGGAALPASAARGAAGRFGCVLRLWTNPHAFVGACGRKDPWVLEGWPRVGCLSDGWLGERSVAWDGGLRADPSDPSSRFAASGNASELCMARPITIRLPPSSCVKVSFRHRGLESTRFGVIPVATLGFAA